MPKLPVLTPRKVLSLLRKQGFVVDHVTGSHYILLHPDGRRVSVPYHTKDIPKGTLYDILKDAGLR